MARRFGSSLDVKKSKLNTYQYDSSRQIHRRLWNCSTSTGVIQLYDILNTQKVHCMPDKRHIFILGEGERAC